MSTDFEKIWITSAELQGLLWNLKDNVDGTCDRLLPQIKCVLSQLNEMIGELDPDSETGTPADEIPENIETDETETLSVTENNIAPEVEYNEPENENQNNNDIIAENAEFEQEEDAEPCDTETPDEDDTVENEDKEIELPEEEHVISEISEDKHVEDTITESEPDSDLESNSEPARLETPVVQNRTEPICVDEKLSRKISGDIRKSFTLNDKFLYRRELFGNSAQQYNEAMDLISEMKNYNEAETYFLDNYGWSPDNHHVKNFMKILFNHFNS